MLFVSYPLVLSWADYSFVQPAGSFAYAVVALWAHFLLHETFRPFVGPACRILPRVDRGHIARDTTDKNNGLGNCAAGSDRLRRHLRRALRHSRDETIGEVHDFRPSSLLRVMLRAIPVPGCGSASR